MSGWTHINKMTFPDGATSSSTPSKQTKLSRINAMSVEEALLIEFDTDSDSESGSGTQDTPMTDKNIDVHTRMRAVWDDMVSDPADETLPSTSMTPMFSKLSVGTPYKPAVNHTDIVDSAVKITLTGHEAENPTQTREEIQPETQSDSSPSKRRGVPRPPEWTPDDDNTLFSLRNEGKTHKQIGEILGRTVSACQSRYSKLKKEREAATAIAAAAAAAAATTAAAENASKDEQTSGPATTAVGSADTPMVVGETQPLPGGQSGDPMIMD